MPCSHAEDDELLNCKRNTGPEERFCDGLCVSQDAFHLMPGADIQLSVKITNSCHCLSSIIISVWFIPCRDAASRCNLNGTSFLIEALINLLMKDQAIRSLSTLVLLMGVNIFLFERGREQNTAYANRITLKSQLKGWQTAVNPL